ncbi:MAG: sigma-54 dependent transcriptional regulator [Desulfuromonas sp.]|nr:sigma-54 dependent transcriptional regulator [Desulfuromonas sp.]
MIDTKSTLLPAIAPDLVLYGSGAGAWTVVNVSQLLVGHGFSREQLVGAEVDQVFAQAQPSIRSLAEEAIARHSTLDNIHIHLFDKQLYVADVVDAGLSPDYKHHQVFFYLQPLADAADSVTDGNFHGLIGRSAGMLDVYRKIKLYADSAAAVVITGETGTGKELVAQAIHQESYRHNGPFIALNCSAIAEELLESELFGHVKGAFTGAMRSHRGRFERADGGSLFLDEIGDMPLHTQTRLLRVLEEGEVEPVGSEHLIKVNVRVICATNVGLEDAVGQRLFRSDLYHRISVLRIHLPPLRDRREDIPLLVNAFLHQLSHSYQRRVEKLTPEAMELLQAYMWPGNVRELRNVIERVFVENRAQVIGGRAFAEWVRERQAFASAQDAAAPAQRPVALELPYVVDPGRGSRSLSVESIRAAYAASSANLSATARLLGVHRATLYRHLQRLGLRREDL